VAAVSIALNNRETSRISAAVRAKIHKIAEELKYRPHELAKALAERRTRIIGLMVPLRDPIFFNQFIAQALSGIQSALMEHDYNLLVHTPSGQLGRATREKALESRLTDGMIFINTRSCTTRDITETISDLNTAGVRFSMMNSYYGRADIDYVGVDDEALGAAAARNLIKAGHRHIALLSSFSTLPAHIYLVRGLRKMLRDAGGDLDDDVVGCTGYDVSRAFSLLDQWFARSRSRPTAIIAADDSLLNILYDYIETRSLRVPGDISIVARINSPNLNTFRPHPTAFHIPTFEMGKRAAEMLIDSIENPEHVKQRVYLPFTFTEGATT
jgi:LacI family transcriptional regulator